jgi:tRNA threonylcarbamoyl adenosine modification protein (Sua5/YciO/YrdC/YwlC family)
MPSQVINLRSTDDWRDVVHRAVQSLAEGGIVAFPTETVYGLAASALHEDAVARLRTIKGRSLDKPMPLAIKSSDEARDYVPDLCVLGQRLARRCWPGPITLVVDDSHPESLVRHLPSGVQQAVSPQRTIGLRVPGHRAILDVLRMSAGPLVLSSANRSGKPEAITATDLIKDFGDELELVLDDGPCRFGQPSSVVRIRNGRFEILRQGVVPERTLQRLSSMMILFVCTGNTCRSPMAELLCRDMIAKKKGCKIDELEDQGVLVMSAGIAAMMGCRAASEAIETMRDFRLDLTGHETQPLTEPLVRHADTIFVMTQSHREAVVAQWPSAAERTQLLSADDTDISDPIGGSIDRYRRCVAEIAEAMKKRLDKLEL